MQVDITGIELAAPGREVSIQFLRCNKTDVGVPLLLNVQGLANYAVGGYTNTSAHTGTFSVAATTTGTITFDNLTPGSNTLAGSFSFTAYNQTSGATVQITNGTFGK